MPLQGVIQAGRPAPLTRRLGPSLRRTPTLPGRGPGRHGDIRDARTGAAGRLDPGPLLRLGAGRRPRRLALLPQFPLATRLWQRRRARRLRGALRRGGRIGDPWTAQGLSGGGLSWGTRKRPRHAGGARRTRPWAGTPRDSRTPRGSSARLGERQGGRETEDRQRACDGLGQWTEHRVSPLCNVRHNGMRAPARGPAAPRSTPGRLQSKGHASSDSARLSQAGHLHAGLARRGTCPGLGRSELTPRVT